MKKRIFLIVGFVLLTAILAYLVSGFLAQYLFVPILNILRFFWVFISALPQTLWWGILLLSLFVIVYKSLRFRHNRKKQEQEKHTYPISRASMWSKMIRNADNGDYSLWLLANQLSDFIIEMLARRERISKEQARKKVVDGTFELPQNIKSFLITGTEAVSFRHYTDLISRSKTARMSTPSKVELFEIVSFLESNFF
jgi:hypothetical protein